MSFTNYAEMQILNNLLGNASGPWGGTVYIGVSTGDPGESGSMASEPTIGVGGYARVPVVNNGTNWPAATSPGGVGTKKNGTAVVFPEATAQWSGGTAMSWFFIADAASGGNMLASGDITNDKVIDAGDTLRFDADTLVVTLD